MVTSRSSFILNCLLISAMLIFFLASSCEASRFPYAAAAAAASGRSIRKILEGGGNNKEEMRAVPSGPDPLHHNGGSPNKKPRPSSP